MPRFYCPCPLAIGAIISLPDQVTRHLHVLRLAAGEYISLFNGHGGEYIAVVTTLDKKRATAEIKVFSPREAELPHAITLAQALPEASKMDWIIEKSVELGVTTIQPLAAQRCVVRLSTERAAKKLQHWQGIIEAACEQSSRNRLPQLNEPVEFKEWIQRRDLHQRILLSPRADQSLSEWARHHSPQALTLLIGPEGGFTEQEERLSVLQGAILLSMGPRILRTETAGLAGVAALNAIWGQM